MGFVSNTRAAAAQGILCMLALFFAFATHADTYHIRVQRNGAPVSGVQIYGNYGVNSLPGRFTDSQGEFLLDTSHLASASPSITYTHEGQGLRFEPAELVPSVANCPEHVCTVQAFSGGEVQSVVFWQVIDSRGRAVSGVPHMLAGSLIPCSKVTDDRGEVFFAVKKHSSACSNNDANIENNFYSVIPSSPSGQSCSFTNMLSTKFRACTVNGPAYGYATASCSAAPVRSIGSSVSYEIFVRNDQGGGVAGVEFFGNEGINTLSHRVSNSDGTWRFTTAELGADPRSSYTVVPTGEYLFYPPELTLSPNSCPNNRCTVWAVPGRSQGVIRWSVRDGATPLSGVRLDAGSLYRCGERSYKTTDGAGEAVFPAILRTSCSNSDNSTDNDLVALDPSYPACTFTHNSSTPFENCPTTASTVGEYVAHCGSPEPEHFAISGQVLTREGTPLPGAGILRNGAFAAATDAEGGYRLTLDGGVDHTLKINSASIAYDPLDVQFVKLDRDHRNVNFQAVAPYDLPLASPAPCPVQESYRVSGTVFRANGLPRAGTVIYNNHEEVALSDSEGRFEVSVPRLSNNWFTAERNDLFFDPAGVSLINVTCDASEVNFIETDDIRHTLGGYARDPYGYPIPGVHIEYSYNSATLDTVTDSEGAYLLNVPDDAEYMIKGSKDGFTFTPEVYVGTASTNQLSLDFLSSQAVNPTPTPTPAPAPSLAPTPISTPTPTPSATPLPTAPPTPMPTATATPQPTATSTPTATPTAAPTPLPSAAPTVAPTATITPSPTAVPTLSPTQVPTATPTAQPTVAPTATPTATPTITPVPTATATPAPSVTPVRTPTPIATIAPAPTATATPVPTASSTPAPTVTPTPTATMTPLPTASPTPIATATPLPSASPTATPTAAPTATPVQQLVLNTVCSNNPQQSLRWQVVNPFPIAVAVQWDIYGLGQQGALSVAAGSSDYFTSTTVPGVVNLARLFYGGQQVAVKAASYTQCAVASPTPGETATPLPTASPTPAPTPAETPTPIMTPTPTPTATPTPVPTFLLSGELKGKNGRQLQGSFLNKLRAIADGHMRVVVRGNGITRSIVISDPFSYSIAVPAGRYRITFENNADLEVTSRPKRYDIDLPGGDQAGLNFAVQFKAKKISGASVKTVKAKKVKHE